MATIKDVARLAGVGVGTASRVVSGKGSVALATAERIRKVIEELEFRPSHAARTLLSGSSQMVGVYIPVLKGTFYTPILQVIDTELRAAGLHMVVAFGCGDGDARSQAVEGIRFLIERGCDGMVVISDALLDPDIESLGPKQSKLAVLNHCFTSIPAQCFTADHAQGGVLAAQTLLKLRHRQFAVIAGPSTSPDNVARISGFMAELARQGVADTQVLTLESDFSSEGGWGAARALLATGHAFTALFCANDEMAVGALSYFQQAGVAVPGAVSVLGYDDTYSAEYSAPRLTSVHVPWGDITLNALHWLLNQCYGSEHAVARQFPISVTWRASVAISSVVALQPA
ncbi:MAG: LacI family DNA-binding transcriptional regulator [Betaproteobacteria bacterium]